MKVTLYSKGCIPCINKPLWRQLRAKAAEKRAILIRKDVAKDQRAQIEADVTYGMSVPFIVVDERAMTVERFING